MKNNKGLPQNARKSLQVQTQFSKEQMLAEAETKDEKAKNGKKELGSRMNKKRKSNIKEASMSQEDDNVSIKLDEKPPVNRQRASKIHSKKSILKNGNRNSASDFDSIPSYRGSRQIIPESKLKMPQKKDLGGDTQEFEFSEFDRVNNLSKFVAYKIELLVP